MQDLSRIDKTPAHIDPTVWVQRNMTKLSKLKDIEIKRPRRIDSVTVDVDLRNMTRATLETSSGINYMYLHL